LAKKLKRGAYMTDIHFGKKANSQQHNEDCLKFIDWFCDQVKKDGKIDYVAFLGDWNENRSALNIATLNYSYQGAKKLDALGVPVYFVVGNHDLYQRHTRDVHSIIHFQEFKNFILIDQPTVVKSIENEALFVPYLFHDEYPSLTKYLSMPYWAGHFEFKGFEVTGYGMILPVGPDPKDFKGPKHIISGHFHKRQANDNVIYMGNAFPMDFGDAGDSGRGMMVFDHVKQEPVWTDWVECPMYIKTVLSDVLDGKIVLPTEARVKCLVDLGISFEESNYLRKHYTEKAKLREFVLEESPEITAAITDTEVKSVDMSKYDKLSTVDDLVRQMLTDVESDHIDNQMLIQIYTNLAADPEK
jgi:DNA repair exonuclease SbcCD nuclease subunit